MRARVLAFVFLLFCFLFCFCQDDKKDAEEIRKRAMERLGDIMKRSENEGKVKKRRSSGNNTLEYLKERNERIDELRKQELELKKQE